VKLRAVIWDLGGVLLRTVDSSPREELAGRLGIDRWDMERRIFSSPSALQAQLGLMTLEEHWEYVRQDFRLQPDEMAVFQEQFWSGDRLDETLVAYIRSLRPRFQTALLSNYFPGLRRELEHRLHIADAFDEVVISSEIGLLKPDPRIYQMVIDRLDVQPGQAVFIDDFPDNIAGAQAVGLHAIHFRNSTQIRQELDLLLGAA
jgi:epoxide hydrolase-like predicted phosphatase